MIHLLPGISDISFDVTALQMKVRAAIAGIARYTGMSGSAGFPFTKNDAIGARKRMCMRYMPNEILDSPVMNDGACFLSMHEKSMNAPKVARSTLGVQKAHAHSRIGVSIS